MRTLEAEVLLLDQKTANCMTYNSFVLSVSSL